MSTKLDWLTQEIDGLKEQGLYNNIRTIGSAQGARIIVDGKDVLNFCSNNYLGLANHPKLVEAAKDSTKKYGVGLVTMSGGVSCNKELRKQMSDACVQHRLELKAAQPWLCTDNAAMIGFAAILKLERGFNSKLSEEIDPNLALAV